MLNVQASTPISGLMHSYHNLLPNCDISAAHFVHESKQSPAVSRKEQSNGIKPVSSRPATPAGA
jgi:hypothetical protein